MLIFLSQVKTQNPETPVNLWWMLTLTILILVVGIAVMAVIGRLIRRIYFNPDDRKAKSSSANIDAWAESARRMEAKNNPELDSDD